MSRGRREKGEKKEMHKAAKVLKWYGIIKTPAWAWGSLPQPNARLREARRKGEEGEKKESATRALSSAHRLTSVPKNRIINVSRSSQRERRGKGKRGEEKRLPYCLEKIRVYSLHQDRGRRRGGKEKSVLSSPLSLRRLS